MGWLKKVTFKPSSIHGTGAFAGEFIERGEKVWCFDDSMHVCGPAELGGLDPETLEFALHGGYYHEPARKFVWYEDGMQYVNHADPPIANIGITEWTPLEQDHCKALRDIEPGEELLEDYEFWSVVNLPANHWLHHFYMDFCLSHYDFLAFIHSRRNLRRSIA